MRKKQNKQGTQKMEVRQSEEEYVIGRQRYSEVRKQ